MIVYTKLATLIKEKKMAWKDLCNSGIAANTPQKFSQNRPISTESLNKVCEYLHVQPSEIMEWIPDAEYNKANEEIASIEQQIAELEAKKKQLQGK